MSSGFYMYLAIFIVVGLNLLMSQIVAHRAKLENEKEQAEKAQEQEEKALRRSKSKRKDDDDSAEDEEERERRFAYATVADTSAVAESSFTPAPATISGSLVDTCLQE